MARSPLLIRLVLAAAALAATSRLGARSSLLSTSSNANDFLLASPAATAVFVVEPVTDAAVARAAADLRADVQRVSGSQPAAVAGLEAVASARSLVLVAVVGKSPLLDRLAAENNLDLRSLAGAWESFAISVVREPFPGVDRALVIAGSDRRGAIYGCYEVSAAIGVSPWHWWADVPPPKRDTLAIAAGAHRFGPPSVKYRGIFLNDEDWGLQPWAAKTFEPETGDIGPKTYARLFELLLRLKANTVWPAMHPTTRAFNHYPRNKEVADAYGIVMGSSHAEPMLRNNVDEWTAPKEDYNYLANRAGVLRYWEERVAANGRYENIYTLGMRGIHDSNMVGPKTDAERIRTLEQVLADQRALLARHVRPEVEQVPQMFCAYKEVLELYRQGLRVPDDVTIVWPDDNFGYIRNFASAAERSRSGGFGVYYHLSYLGRPLSYLWLGTTPPALIWEEMHKAHARGADRIWIANVGDVKPAEIGTEFFLQMAWDIDRWQPETLPNFLREWATREFGAEHASEIASILAEYYRLNFQRKPEHLQWWLPRQPRQPSALTDAEVQARLDAFAQLRARTETLRPRIPAAQQDAFYQLVYYPMVGSALANVRFFEAERGHLDVAQAANTELVELTRFFNDQLAGGKWRGMMSLEPADRQWASMRIETWTPPGSARPSVAGSNRGTFLARQADAYIASAPCRGAAWTRIPGLGRTSAAITVLPATMSSVDITSAVEAAPRVDYALEFPSAGEFTLQLHLLPTHPIAGSALRLAAALDDQPPQLVALEMGDGGPEWAQGVLNAARIATSLLVVRQPGQHTLKIYGLDPGVVLDKVVIDLGGLTPSYLGP